MHLFLEYTILGLVTGAVYGIAASGLVLTYTTSGIFNFAQGAMAMLAAFTYWQFRYGWNWPAPLALFTVIAVLAPLLGIFLYARHHARAAKHGRRHQDRGDHRHHARADRAGPVDLEPRSTPDRQPVLRRSGEVQVPRRLRHRSRGDCPRLRRAHRGGHPPAVQEHPHRGGHAGGRRQPGAPPAQRRTAREAGCVLLGPRRSVGRPGGHPHHPHRGWHPRRARADPARPGLHRRRHVRAPPQHLGHVRRSPRPRLVDDLCAGLLPRHLVLGVGLPNRTAHDRALHRPAGAATRPLARRDAAAHARALHRADHAVGRHVGPDPRARRLGPRTDHGQRRHVDPHRRHHVRHHRPVTHLAHRLRR